MLKNLIDIIRFKNICLRKYFSKYRIIVSKMTDFLLFSKYRIKNIDLRWIISTHSIHNIIV